MFSFFKRNKKNRPIDRLQINLEGWKLEKNTKELKEWSHSEIPAVISLNYFDLPPDLASRIDIEKIRLQYREMLDKNGGIIVVEKVPFKEKDSVKTLFKFPQDPVGMNYAGGFTIPFDSCSYVLQVFAPEIGMTGMRDNVVATQLEQEGVISIGERGFENWFVDPYDSSITEGIRMNLSEAEKFDVDFPKHPLSIIRRTLKELEQEIIFDNTIEDLKPFFNS